MTFHQEVTRMSCDDACWSGKWGEGSKKLIVCQIFCRKNSDVPKLESQGYCLWGVVILYPCVEFQCAQRVTLHKVFCFVLVTCACNFMTG